VIVTSDNGEAKGTAYEQGVRTMLHVRGPGISAGTTVTDLVNNIDLAPTLLDWAGSSAAKVNLATDGLPWSGVASGALSTNGRSELFVEMGYDRAVITSDNYKYLYAGQGAYANLEARGEVLGWYAHAGVEDQLYNLATDGAEQTNLAGTEASKLAELKTKMSTHRAATLNSPVTAANLMCSVATLPSPTTDIALNAGWTWISFNRRSPDMSLASMTAEVTWSAGDLIKTQTRFAQFYANFGWFPGDFVLDVNTMYTIKTDAAKILKVRGAAVTLPSSIFVQPGWNWIPAHYEAAQDLNDEVFEFAAVSVTDLLKSQTSFTSYYSTGWFGTLNALYPGAGYKLKAKQAGTIRFKTKPLCPLIIDVRSAAEWDAGHVSCAQRLEIQNDAALVETVRCYTGGKMSYPIQVYCRSGSRAGQAVAVLQGQNFTAVTNAGGYDTNGPALTQLCACSPQPACNVL